MATISPIFSDGAVFAANLPIRIFGEGSGHISVEFLGSIREADATEKDWCVEFEPLPYGGPYEMTITLDGNATVLHDLWIGEVLLLSGQSNIEFRMKESKDYPELSEPCPMLRVFHAERVDQKGHFRPMHGWKCCDTDDVIANTSAIGYETGLLLAKRLGCAIGLLSASQGASVIQSWVPEGAYERIGLTFTQEELNDSHFKYPLWNGFGQLYTTMLKPWFPYSLSNVIWYQGESNTSIAESIVYKQMLAELIRIWRNDFKNEELPFIVVQLADYDSYLQKKPVEWRNVQKAQLEIQDEVANVKSVVCRDVCETNDIHPPTKRYLSERIASLLCDQ
jgi:sialate O-acetylesterase